MKNKKFIIHNNTTSFDDYEIFEFIVYIMKKGLLSNKGTEYCYCTVRQFEKIEYCYCTVRQFEKIELVCTFNKTKNNYRIDVYEKIRSKKNE